MFNKNNNTRGLLKIVSVLFAILQLNGLVAQNVFTVTKTTDPDPFTFPYNYNDGICNATMLGTLQWAVRKAIDPATTGTSTIKFNIPGGGVQTIAMVYALPAITKQVFIDATTQPGYAVTAPTVVMYGPTPATTTLAFDIQASNSKIKGLYIKRYNDAIKVTSTDYCEILDNIINEIDDRCIEFYRSNYCTVKGNYINTDASLVTPSLVAEEGVFFTNGGSGGSSYNIIGGIACGEGNIIKGTTSEGIDNEPTTTSNPALNKYNLFSGNRIYGCTYNAINLRLPSGGNQSKAYPSISTVSGMVVTGTAGANDKVEVFASAGTAGLRKDANEYLGMVVADALGAWTINLKYRPLGFLTATATDALNNTSELDSAVVCTVNTTFLEPMVREICVGNPVVFNGNLLPCMTYSWDFGDGTGISTTAGANPSHFYTSSGSYTVTLTYQFIGNPTVYTETIIVNVVNCIETGCDDCIGSFAPTPGNYIVSAWVKEANSASATTYSNAGVSISFIGSGSIYGPFIPNPAEKIIDGWQRIESTFTVPASATQILITLVNNGGSNDAFFDDIRIHPTDSNIKTYVYDPVTLRLSAELDQNNYATFYEYDEEGALIRVKKETEKGIVTIKETRNNNKK